MKTTTKKQQFTTGFLAGLGAGIVATGFMLILNQVLGGISLPEVFGSFLTALMPASMFDYLHQLIGGDAKHYLFYGIIVGQCLIFALAGAIYNVSYASFYASRKLVAVGKQSPIEEPRQAGTTSQSAEGKLQQYQGLVLAFALWLLVGLVFLPLTGSGIFGSQLSTGFD